jgi:hypothetical protein
MASMLSCSPYVDVIHSVSKLHFSVRSPQFTVIEAVSGSSALDQANPEFEKASNMERDYMDQMSSTDSSLRHDESMDSPSPPPPMPIKREESDAQPAFCKLSALAALALASPLTQQLPRESQTTTPVPARQQAPQEIRIKQQQPWLSDAQLFQLIQARHTNDLLAQFQRERQWGMSMHSSSMPQMLQPALTPSIPTPTTLPAFLPTQLPPFNPFVPALADMVFPLVPPTLPVSMS